MRQRCGNARGKVFKDYGGRGISVCERWQNFNNFADDMGPYPGAEFSIDRIDNDKGYCPENCRWATKTEQILNRRNTVFLEHNGVKLTLKEWADKSGIPYKTLHRRMQAGVVAASLFNPVRPMARRRIV